MAYLVLGQVFNHLGNGGRLNRRGYGGRGFFGFKHGFGYGFLGVALGHNGSFFRRRGRRKFFLHIHQLHHPRGRFFGFGVAFCVEDNHHDKCYVQSRHRGEKYQPHPGNGKES